MVSPIFFYKSDNPSSELFDQLLNPLSQGSFRWTDEQQGATLPPLASLLETDNTALDPAPGQPDPPGNGLAMARPGRGTEPGQGGMNTAAAAHGPVPKRSFSRPALLVKVLRKMILRLFSDDWSWNTKGLMPGYQFSSIRKLIP